MPMRIAILCACLLLSLGRAAADGPPTTAHPRFLLGTLGDGLRSAYAAHKRFATLAVDSCNTQLGRPLAASGYQGWDWANWMATCTVAWHATADNRYANLAVSYWKALLDDRDTVGDGNGGIGEAAGGTFVDCQDSGYSMRTYGVYAALGLDWLYSAPNVDSGVRAHAVARLERWGDWYELGSAACPSHASGGYANREPASNYFMGYFLATWAAAIAVGSDDVTVGDKLWNRGARLLDELVTPALSGKLAGGDQYEGWQYGELTVASLALVSAALSENGRPAFANGYLHDSVALHLYSLHPGNQQFFDSGDHGSHPVTPGTTAVLGALVAIPSDSYAPLARQYVNLIGDNSNMPWLAALAEARAPSWPRAEWSDVGLPLSFFARGTGTVLARSGWGPDDVWVSLQSAGRGSGDHQHCDAAHFEITRGSDDLVIDTADYGTYASWNHNTLEVDDSGANSTYSPLQGPFAKPDKVRITHVAELGAAVAAEADFGGAYINPNGGNSVRSAKREWIYLRPNLLLIADRAQLAAPSTRVTFDLHTPTQPTTSAQLLTANVGLSQLSSLTLLPTTTTLSVVAEPVSGAGDGPWHNNTTFAPAYRGQESTVGTSASFVHLLRVGPKASPAPAATLTQSGQKNIVTIAGEMPQIVVLPASVDGTDLTLPVSYTIDFEGPSRHIVFGMSAATSYSVNVFRAASNCLITVFAGYNPMVASADRGAAFEVSDCVLKPPPYRPDGGLALTDMMIEESAADAGVAMDPLPSTAASGCHCSFAGVSSLSSLLLPLLLCAALVARQLGLRLTPDRARIKRDHATTVAVDRSQCCRPHAAKKSY